MGRTLRYSLTEDIVTAIDFGFPRAGKLLIRNAGSNDVRIGYDPSDVDATTGVNYYTMVAGQEHLFDLAAGIGFLSQNQQLYLCSVDGDNVMEIWFANDQ